MTEADVKAQLDERRLARALALGLPLGTVAVAVVVGVVLGVPLAILVLAAGTLLGVISLLWASLRVLQGDAALPPELEALDRTAHGVDALASRRRMLVRALKDLENEHALGKLDDEDFAEITSTYRSELKEVLKRIDASLEPFRAKAEEAARAHLARVGLAEAGYRGSLPQDETAQPPSLAEPAAKAPLPPPSRIACAECSTSNEPDAKFCKSCGAALRGEAKSPAEPET